MTARTGVAAVLDKCQLGVWGPQNMVMVQVNRSMKLLDTHIHHDSDLVIATL
jgi:hypothetical protein